MTSTVPTKSSRLPAPQQLMICKLSEAEVAETIEKYICYVDRDTGRPVHLQPHFVKHYMRRHDGALPTLQAIAQLPIVLYDGSVLGGHGLNRKYGVFFAIAEELDDYLPTIDECTPAEVAEAMHFLADHWLVDVAATYQDKCILIAAALTVIEAALLPQRPAFFVTAGKRSSGKTTTLHMLAMAATGIPAAAAAWSTQVEERRKALFAYLGAGLRLLIWDNIQRGTLISCPAIEKALTSEFYSDRILAKSETRTVPSYTVQFFTGNNIGPKGDMVSRSLIVRLFANTADPENRNFSRPGDPVAWTNNHRGEILRALYTLLLGNPRRRQNVEDRSPAPTRFKEWWDVVASAVEHGAHRHAEWTHNLTLDPHPQCKPHPVNFKRMFLEGDAEDAQENAMASVLKTILDRWLPGATARAIAQYANSDDFMAADFVSSLEAASGKPLKTVTPTTITWRLKAIVDAPTQVGNDVLVLRFKADHQAGTFTVEAAA